MEIKYLSIKNFKSIRHMEISDIQNALILVGKNNTGKSSILHALRAVEGSYEISLDDFNETMQKYRDWIYIIHYRRRSSYFS